MNMNIDEIFGENKIRPYADLIIKPRGIVYFKRDNGKLIVDRIEKYNEEYNKEYKIIGDLIDGASFFDAVDDGGFIDYDGTIRAVFINGWISNIGLKHKGIYKKGWSVNDSVVLSGKEWEDLCGKPLKCSVYVEWCNK